MASSQPTADNPRRKSAGSRGNIETQDSFPYPDLEHEYPFCLPPAEYQSKPLLGDGEGMKEGDAQGRTEQDEERVSKDGEPAKWQHPVSKVKFVNSGTAPNGTGKRKSVSGDRRHSTARRQSVPRRRHSRRYSVSAQQTVPGKICAVWRNIYTVLSLREWLALFVMVGYAMLGGAIFSWLEQENTRKMNSDLKERLRREREELGREIISITNEPWLYSSTDEQWRAVVNKLNKYQLDSGLGPKAKPQWDLWDGVFYSVTIFTTIGYGHYTPVTKLGRLATILYALIGIPLLLAILADFGRILTRGLKRIWTFVRNGIRRVLAMRRFRRIQKAAERAGLSLEDEGEGIGGIAEEDEEFNFPIPLAIFMIVSWLFICAAFFLIWETGWTYFEAFYFFFISLSTIGLGDIVPEHQKYMILNFPFVLIGLSLVTLVINLIQNKIEEMKEKAEDALEDQLGIEDTETESEGAQTDVEPGDTLVWPKPQDGDTDLQPAPGDTVPPREPGPHQPHEKQKAKKKAPARVNLGIIQTFKLPKRRRRIGTQTEDSFVRDIRMRDRKGRQGYDRSSMLTGNSEYFDAESLID